MVIVAIDDASTSPAAEGPWPWPREKQAKLISAILAAGAAAVGVDEMWVTSTARGDDALANAISDGPVVIGVEGVMSKGPGGGAGLPGPFATFKPLGGAPRLTDIPSYAGVQRSIPAIDLAAAGHGVLSNDPDPDGTFRRLHLISAIGGQVVPNFALDVYRLAARDPFPRLFIDRATVRGVGVDDSVFPADPDGSLRIDFARREDMAICSAETLLKGRVCRAPQQGPAISLAGQVVLVGVEATGAPDQGRMTPVGPMAGVEIQAQGLENLFTGALVSRPSHAPAIEAALTLVLGLFLIAVLPLGRLGWQAGASLAPLVGLILVGALAWARFRLLIDVATPAMGYGLVFLGMLGGGLAEADAQRRRLRRELEIGKLAAARAEGEMEAGRRIQMGILPKPGSLAADRRFDLHALMVPARQIGGDLYDFFKIDADHLFIAVGDVSGKGLPASLFMALGKSLCKSCALRGETDISAIVRRANAEISRDNPEMLFITLFAGILDLRGGELRFCNAGHDAPFLLRASEPPRAVLGEGGPPLCVVDDFPYQTEICRLSPGDMLCLTTDGVTEAMTRDGVLMGRGETERVLAGIGPDASAKMVIGRLQAAVEGFIDGAAPSDDLTILSVRWIGPAPDTIS